jgi:ADP-heptose:LPS heptosyltransferase
LLNIGAGNRFQNFDIIERNPKNILISTASGIGDTIMVAPAIKKLKDKFPQAGIIALAHYSLGSNEVFDLMPYIDETIDLPIANYKWSGVIRFMFGKFWFLLFKLRSRKIDLAVFFMPNILRRFLLAGIGAKKWLYGKRVNDYPGEIAFELLEPLQIARDKPEQVFSVPVPENSENILPSRLQRPIIGVHPFCGISWKEWHKFGELLERLRTTKGTVVVLGKQDGYETQEGVIDLVNRISLSELFWVISRLDLLITADSGPMHIGFALDIPTVALFGFVPPGFLVSENAFKNHKIIYKPVPGITPPERVKQRERLNDSVMQSITVDEVIQASIELLLERRGIKLEQCVEDSL